LEADEVEEVDDERHSQMAKMFVKVKGHYERPSFFRPKSAFCRVLKIVWLDESCPPKQALGNASA
jgi:hypothetical protein